MQLLSPSMDADLQSVHPLRNLIAVRPDPLPDETEGGIVRPGAYAYAPPVSGTVVAIGQGVREATRRRKAIITRCLQIVEDADDAVTKDEAITRIRDGLVGYLRSDEDVHACAVGQRVIFPPEAGKEVVLGDSEEHTLVMLAEDELLAVYDKE